MTVLHRLFGLALDSQYKHRYQLYYLADGPVEDSRIKNWRQVDWEKVVRVETYIKDKKHVVDCSDPRFQFFVVFRWGGREYTPEGSKIVNIWTQGWSDGANCWLVDIDFKSGATLKKYEAPVSTFMGHIHPRVADKATYNKVKKTTRFGNFFLRR